MSDHISGPRALAEPIADITDVYAFPSPETPGHLVLVVNTLPFAPPDAQHSDGLIYRFRIRPLTPQTLLYGHVEREFVLDCVFDDGKVSCSVPDGVRVFAGTRWDPFMLDAPAALKTVASGQLAFTDPSSIYLDGKNVLSIVLEVDPDRVLDGHRLVGVVAETLTRGRLTVRIERTGRPEVKNLILGPKQFDQVNRDLEIRDLYNMEDAYHLADGYIGAYRARLNANLAFWDQLDGKADWPLGPNGVHPLTELILADRLVVDAGKPYQESGSFLEIERSALAGLAHRTCGGRALNDDAMDTLFTFLINAGNGPVIRDGVDRASRPATRVFPYLAEPNPDPPQPPPHH
ncbi:hypothetical protein GCM10010168_93140 [Actinoplanes ianthinogenes]|uniref:DUF4331 family protein n=1 Tax=Actinoplanes ianthinogenes TaxID=122358 RepID=UPI001670B21B|nr:DUF4331 family protein [Actinoplanes ianthinogenes]GGR59673.1 hypothetical protein GCM10010168_93140 [Actinoplanes ianthinogenes]